MDVTPWGDTLLTKKGADHFDLSFPGNSLNLELYNKTSCPELISLDTKFLSWYILVMAL